MCIHYNIKVTGKVQGVWFRKHTFDKAIEMDLKGFVQNESDTSVYVEVEDSDVNRLQNFIDWLYKGSPLSMVENVMVKKEKICKDFTEFEIRRF